MLLLSFHIQCSDKRQVSGSQTLHYCRSSALFFKFSYRSFPIKSSFIPISFLSAPSFPPFFHPCYNFAPKRLPKALKSISPITTETGLTVQKISQRDQGDTCHRRSDSGKGTHFVACRGHSCSLFVLLSGTSMTTTPSFPWMFLSTVQ